MVEVDPFRDESFYHLEKVKCASVTRRLIRQVDLYALPITLRYKSEKMFYTNFGAATSILLILGMLGLLLSEVLTMISLNKLFLTTSTIPVDSKDEVLDRKGALFLFGYRILDLEDNLYEDTSVLDGEFLTTTHTWNNDR